MNHLNQHPTLEQIERARTVPDVAGRDLTIEHMAIRRARAALDIAVLAVQPEQLPAPEEQRLAQFADLTANVGQTIATASARRE